jgi:antitoxin CcdA
MRMGKRRLEEPAKPFRRAKANTKMRAKQAVNVSVDAALLKVAKEMKINLSQALERALRDLTGEERARRFYEENKAFIDHHNTLVEKYGTSSDAYAREFGNDD